MEPIEIPASAASLSKAFASAGFELYLVGGWVRDALLELVHTDLDFATNARPEQSLDVLARWTGNARTWKIGIDFGTVGAEKDGVRVEVTTFRSEVYGDDSRNPEVSFADDLASDLSRRDFTVNGMAIGLPGGELIDPFHGVEDLAARKLRTPMGADISFSDDPLRMLRALRFVSTLRFRLDREVADGIRRMSERLAIVTPERIQQEFSRLVLGEAPAHALELAVDSGLADRFIPELSALRLEQDPVHRHKDVFRHTLAVLERVMALETSGPDLALRLAALLHDVGKPKTRKFDSDGVSFHHHEVVGADMAEARLRKLRYPARLVEEVRELVYLHLRFHTYRLGWTDRAVRRYVRDAGALLPQLNALVRADCTTRNALKARELAARMDELEERISDLAAREELSAWRPSLDGNEVMAHLKIPPGPAVGEAIEFLMEIRMEEGEIDKAEAYRRLDAWWTERGGASE